MDSTCFGSDDPESGFFLVADPHPESVKAVSSFEFEAEIGRGGTGVVYRARDLDLQRLVAIKILHSELVDRDDIIQRFVKEAYVMGTLQHPGIAQIYSCGFTPSGRPFNIMKLVEGETFGDLLTRHEEEEERITDFINVFAKVCETMAYTHSKGVLHLDLKPNNVMVGPFGEVHLMDWGLAKAMPPRSNEPSLNDIVPAKFKRVQGTPKYMAPEQARAEQVDARTDVFCLGAILCRILTGRAPYVGDTMKEIVKKARAADLSSAYDILESCDENAILVRLATSCLQENPDLRPADATEVAQEISRQSVEHLHRAEEDLARFFELSLDLFCIAGFDGFFRRINGNFSEVLGYSEGELLSRPFLDFVIEEDRPNTIEVMRKLLDGEPVVRFRNRYHDRDGNLLEFEWTAKSIPQDNVIYAVARNVTEKES